MCELCSLLPTAFDHFRVRQGSGQYQRSTRGVNLCLRAMSRSEKRDREFASSVLSGRAVFITPYLSQADMCLAYIANNEILQG
jgi:hypothetical protein